MARRTIILGLLFSFVYTPITLADSPRGAQPAGGQKPKPGAGQDTTPTWPANWSAWASCARPASLPPKNLKLPNASCWAKSGANDA